jgi:hypothetical protein
MEAKCSQDIRKNANVKDGLQKPCLRLKTLQAGLFKKGSALPRQESAYSSNVSPRESVICSSPEKIIDSFISVKNTNKEDGRWGKSGGEY